MHLESSIKICRTPQQVWSFLWDIDNVAKWDRGVASAKQISSCPVGVGYEFETIGHPRRGEKDKPWGRMSYRVTDMDPSGRCTVQLTSSSGNARYFKTARWNFRTEQSPEGTLLTCSVEFALRLRYIILAPALYVMKGALYRDLKSLKQVLEAE